MSDERDAMPQGRSSDPSGGAFNPAASRLRSHRDFRPQTAKPPAGGWRDVGVEGWVIMNGEESGEALNPNLVSYDGLTMSALQDSIQAVVTEVVLEFVIPCNDDDIAIGLCSIAIEAAPL